MVSIIVPVHNAEKYIGATVASVKAQTYTDWEEIHVPRLTINRGLNPHHQLDYRRFVSDSAVSFCRLQADILRKYKKPGDFITTNGLFNLDNHRL